MLEKIKRAARISHNRLNFEIERLVGVARSDLIRAGVPEDNANSDDPLIEDAIIAFALSRIASSERDRADNKESYLFILENLRRHNWM